MKDEQRQAFETWMSTKGAATTLYDSYTIAKDQNGEYEAETTRVAWRAWQFATMIADKAHVQRMRAFTKEAFKE